MRRSWSSVLLLVPTLALIAVLAGCPKRPMMPVASAPAPVVPAPAAPVATAPTAPAAMAPEPAAPPTVTPTPAPAPPEDYALNAATPAIHFDFDRSAIRPADAKILEASAAWLKANPNQLVLIEGHCDERGTSEYNLALADRRATAARDNLTAQGVAADRITIVSYGKEWPLCREHTETCWAKNRRDEFLTKER
jgi:peptidoglycan-associated lipoprotein